MNIEQKKRQFWIWVKYTTNELEKVFTEYGDCSNCDHKICCKIYPPVINNDEILRIAKFKKISIDDLKKKFLLDYIIELENGKTKNDYIINQIPCPFLDNNKCSIYPVRPLSCKQYPFQTGLQLILDGFEICPIATLLASEIWELHQDIITEIPKEKIEETEKKFEKTKTTLRMDERKKRILNPLDELYKKMGITDITMQSYSDIYPWPLFNQFVKEKKLNFNFKIPDIF